MKYFLFFIIALTFAALCTPLVLLGARKAGYVVAPRTDRWHTTPTPILGGIAIFISFISLFLYNFGFETETLSLVLGGTLIFLLGLYDDVRGLTPQIKFIGQIAVAGLLISMGTVIIIIPYPVVSYPLTFFWIVGLTNAFNLIDNMDGLSAGIAAISSGALFVFSLLSGDEALAFCSIVLAGACIGFLLYNFNPARIFMGDCGSMFLGFTLAALSISGTWRHASSLFVTFLVPVVILGIPILDTAFVTFTRKLRGQPISQGGKDHMSHRLVALGFSERTTVLILYSISAIIGLGALFFNMLSPAAFAMVALIFSIALFYFCIYLGYAETRNGNNRWTVLTNANRQVRVLLVNMQRFGEIFVDLVLIVMAYFTAYLIRFEGGVPELQLTYFMQTLPIVVVIKVAVLYYFGLYQTVWRHVGVRDFVNILKSVFVSSLIIVVSILMYARFQYFSRTVFVVDAMLSLLLISGAHFFLRILREYLESQPLGGKRVLLIGAGDAGEMALREIRNNPGMKFNVVGFLDDDTFKLKRKIHGVQVLGKINEVGRIAHRTGAQEAFIAIPSATEACLEKIMQVCRQHNIICTIFSDRDTYRTENS